jgi:hypothetical protein
MREVEQVKYIKEKKILNHIVSNEIGNGNVNGKAVIE